MIRAGVIGMGFMGGVHLRNWQALDGADIAAVCDANPIAGAAKQGNIDASPDALDLDGVAVYTDAAEMLANENLDAVSIALPTHLHKAVSIQCLEAGVHVLCEKPMALNTPDCDAMIAAASKAGRHLMVAHCVRF
ncbi:MAG: Gfo/Idh/MocA family oxidoreductase, partial [Verrucomicrobiota bacterium]|nr:Gfo/Idh/MocA family oxidoreductase [Verrucomicrobiota bacterium]